MRAVVFLVPFLALHLAASALTEQTETRREPLAMGAKLWVKQKDGRVEIQGWDRSEVEVVGTFLDSSRGERVLLDLHRVAEGLEIELRHPKDTHFTFGSYTSARCNLVIKVPRKLNLAVQSVDGDISVKNVEGFARCESVDGNIRLEDLSGEGWVQTVDGRIEGKRLKARLKGSTVDGRIHLEDVEGGLDLHTVDGNIEARHLNGWQEGISLRTVEGSIKVILGQAKGQVEARSKDGAIRCTAPNLVFQEQRNGLMRAEIPGSTQEIRLRSTGGDIRIE